MINQIILLLYNIEEMQNKTNIFPILNNMVILSTVLLTTCATHMMYTILYGVTSNLPTKGLFILT